VTTGVVAEGNKRPALPALKALLINPPTGLFIREDRCQAPLKGMAATMTRTPLDLAYMAATMEQKGVECLIRDYPAEGAKWEDYKADLASFRPDLVFISVTSFTIKDDLVACVMAKEALGAKVTTVAKGAHVSVMAREVMESNPALYVAIQGEYELAAQELAVKDDYRDILGITFRDRKNGEIVSTPTRPYLEDLDSLPYPARHLLNNGLYRRPDTDDVQTTVQSCRGCPSSCIFCLAPVVYGSKIRLRSPANVVVELAECAEKYGIRDFFFRADTFTFNRQWVLDLCAEINCRRLKIRWVCNSRVDTIDADRLVAMKKAGCYGVAFGIESGSPEILVKMKKGINLDKARAAIKLCREHGMTTLLYFVMGLPWETEEDIKKSVDFALELGGDMVEFHLAIPFPGTELHKIVERDGLRDGNALDGYDYARSPLRTYSISADQLVKLRLKAMRRIYLNPASLWRISKTMVKGLRSPRQLWHTIKFGFMKASSLLFPGK